ncbi:MAG: hypothetical protein ACFCD0_21915 [Gemmataceae bacterium]
MLEKLLNLQPGEWRRLLPFFFVYSILFGGFTLADGLSLTLFVNSVGSTHLPTAYTIIAVANLIGVSFYFFQANRLGSVATCYLIFGTTGLLFLGSWTIIRFTNLDVIAYGILFVTREISLNMILLHFGTYLQDYFDREEIKRVLPIVYAGGRLGGIVGASVLENASAALGLINLILLVFATCLVAVILVARISRKMSPRVTTPSSSSQQVLPSDSEVQAARYLSGFVYYVWQNQLLLWITVTSIVFIVCRWILYYQYNTFFQNYFSENEFNSLVEELMSELSGEPIDDDSPRQSMAQFLGRYTQIALGISLGLQLLVVSRLIRWLGTATVHSLYALTFLIALALNLGTLTLSLAVVCRFVETELRFGIRNPVMQLVTNEFTKDIRTRVRAWTLGILIPVATLIASGLLAFLAKAELLTWLSWIGVVFGLGYLTTSLLMGRSLRNQKPTDTPKQSRRQVLLRNRLPD